MLLADQDRSLWDRELIRSGVSLIERASKVQRTGPYQIEAAIAAVHCESPAWEETDWPQLLELYSLLLGMDPSPVVRLNRAVIVGRVCGPAAALEEIEAVAPQLRDYHLYHATRASFLRELGKQDEAREADRQALMRTSNPAEQSLLRGRLDG